jgi:type I restriction enzyme, S subunit
VNQVPQVRVGELVTISGGGTPSRSNPDFFGGDIPWVTPKDMKAPELTDSLVRLTERGLRESPARLIPADSVLVVVRSGVLKHSLPVAINRVPVALNQDMKALSAGSRLHPEYLAHYLRAITPVILRWVRATTADNFPVQKLRELPLPLPPLTEQRRIAHILDQADALRSKRRQALAHLDALTQSIFLDMFGDPVSNPKGWPNPTLGKLQTFQQYGPRFYNETYSAEGVRIVRITDLNEAGGLDFSAMPRMAVTPQEREKYALRAGDLIFARSGSVGKVAVIRAGDPVCIAGAYFIAMRFDAAVEPLYARAVLTSPAIRAVVAKQSRQAVQQNFSGPALRRLPMPVPPLHLQRRFVRIANTIDMLRTTHRSSLAQLNALFSSLQHRAFRGEL